MSVKIINNMVSLRDKTTGKMLPVGMFGSGADKTLEEIKKYADDIQVSTKNTLDDIESAAKISATNTLNKVINDANMKVSEAENRRNDLVDGITSVLDNGTDDTLTLNGVAADAKVTGDYIREIQNEMIMSPQLFDNTNIANGVLRGSGNKTSVEKSIPAVAYHNATGINVEGHAGETIYFSVDGVVTKALYVVCEIATDNGSTFTEVSDTDNYTIPTNAKNIYVSFNKDYLSKFQAQYGKVTKSYPYNRYITKIMIEDMNNEISEIKKMLQSLISNH